LGGPRAKRQVLVAAGRQLRCGRSASARESPRSGHGGRLASPIGLAGGGLNLSGYADGDPINKSDPLGLCPMCEVAATATVTALASKAIDPANERRIASMDESVQASARLFVNLSAASGNPVRVTEGFRSFERQDELYAQGRTTPGDIVTNARGGQSYHNFGLAMDLAPVVGGRVNPFLAPSAQTVKIGVSLGWEWGGNWRGFKDRPHFQMTGGQTMQQLNAGRP
jgi:peptidoglycan LD-endopeptidase CwlK